MGGQEEVAGGDDTNDAAKQIKQLFIVSGRDNKTIIETIRTEEEKKDFIKRSKLKRRRRIKSEPSRQVSTTGNPGRKIHLRGGIQNVKDKKKMSKKKKVEEPENILSPEEWLEKFYSKSRLK